MLCVYRSGAVAVDSAAYSYSIRHYTDEDGLPQNSIRAISQDECGFIWLATEDGLSRFDGNSFFTYNNTNLQVSSNRFVNIWNSMYGGGLYTYSLNHEYVRIRNGKAVTDMAYTAYSKLLFPTLAAYGLVPRDVDIELFPWGGKGFYLYENGHIYSFRNNKPEFVISYAADDGKDIRFFITDGTLYHNDSNGVITSFAHGRPAVVRLTGDIEHNPYYRPGHSAVHFLPNNTENGVLLWLGKAIYSCEKQKDGSLSTKLVIDDFDFDNNRIASAFYDRQREMIFLGSVVNGLYVLRRKQFRTLKVGNSEVNNDYYALAPYDSNSIVTPQGAILSDRKQQQRILRKEYYNQYTILADRQGYIWMDKDLLRRYTRDFRLAGQWRIGNNDLIALHQGPTGTVWAALRNGTIMRITNPDTARTPVPLPVTFPGVSYIVQEDEHTLWLAAVRGLYRLHLGNMHIDTISGLSGKYVRSLCLSGPGQLWITTYGYGFYLYANGRLTDFPEDEGHFLNAAHCLIEDDQGYFWITTNKGLFKAAKKDLLAYAAGKQQEVFYLYYGKNNGFSTNEFNGGCEPCGVKLPGDKIALPSLDGVVWISARDLADELPDRQIFVDRILLNDHALPVADNIVLGQHSVPLNISVSTPYFGDRRNVHMYYQLTEDDGDAVYMPVPASGTISLQNLSTGKYLLTICKMNGFGKDNYTRKLITITVPPFWYQTAWFYTAAILLLLALVYLFINLRTRYLINKNRMLEIIIRKRTQNLEQALRSLETSQSAQAKQTYIQERLVAAISHDIRTPLKYLSFSNRKIHQLLQSQEADGELLEISKSAADAATRMHHYLGNLLQYVKTSLKKGDIKADMFDLYSLVDEHVAMFADVAQLNHTTIHNNVPQGQEIYANRQLLAIILHNVLDNAVKNTFNGIIDITAVIRDGAVNIIIADNGSGIPAALQEWVNNGADSFDGAEHAINPMAHAGMGLFIVKELSALIKARLYIASDNSTGTAVHISLEQ